MVWEIRGQSIPPCVEKSWETAQNLSDVFLPVNEMGDTVLVVPACPGHLPEMVQVHMASFPGEFLTLLGPGFLRIFYRYFIGHPKGISLVAVKQGDGCVIGLVTGGAPELRSNFLRKHILRFFSTSLSKSFTNYRVRERLCEHIIDTLRVVSSKLRLVSPKNSLVEPVVGAPGTWSNLLSVCVHPDYVGCGIGRKLMEGFRISSAQKGYLIMRLSVHNDNEAAIALYKKSGWQAVLTCPSGTYFKRSIKEDG
jgi:ribosomal protein S18 acetylase RimI-like enzyme